MTLWPCRELVLQAQQLVDKYVDVDCEEPIFVPWLTAIVSNEVIAVRIFQNIDHHWKNVGEDCPTEEGSAEPEEGSAEPEEEPLEPFRMFLESKEVSAEAEKESGEKSKSGSEEWKDNE